ncbi:4Fe-4S dicluster domain-containing protein [Chloroflexota bacterium]
MKLIEVSPELCVGCRLCEMVCSLAHFGECGTVKSNIRVYRDEEYGNNLISMCMHCADAPCLEACAAIAISRNESGVVVIDEDSCTGCGDCVNACPLFAISIDNSNMVAFKCDLCGGEPECVQICSRQALSLVEIDPGSETRIDYRDNTSKLLKEALEATSSNG